MPDANLQMIEGCLLGCAVGDSIGLPYEGMSPARQDKFRPSPLNHRFIFRRGMVSDDTDHTAFVAQAMSKHPDSTDQFLKSLAWKLRFWLLCFPAGAGMATLKSAFKLWLGFSPKKSGIASAGNGPAMRSAIIGVFHHANPESRKAFVQASTRMTHTDPKAEFGAQAVAAIAAWMAENRGGKPELSILKQILLECGDDDEWPNIVSRIVSACEGSHPGTELDEQCGVRGVSGYIYHTVPAAISAWYIHHGDFASTVECAVRLGGDCDTVAAIAGALSGITTGRSGIPEKWIGEIIDRPHSPAYLTRLAKGLLSRDGSCSRFSPWLFPRGILFTGIVLLHGLRRLFPPY